jgi:hypothetical protein
MLIGLTGQLSTEKDAIADYLCRTHAFVRAERIDDPLIDEVGGHHVVIHSIDTAADASTVTERGGVLLHLVEAGEPDFGPGNGIELRDIDRQLTITPDLFRAFDILDALVGEAEFLENAA